MAAVLLCLAAAALYAQPAPPSAPVLRPTPPPSPDTATLPEGMVGVPVRLAEPAAAATLRQGDRVDLLTVPDGAVVATGALVLTASDEGDVLLLAFGEAQARKVVQAGPQARFSVILRARGSGARPTHPG